MICVLGIDPGLSGALAFYFSEAPTRVTALDMPVVDGNVAEAIVTDHCAQFRPDHAIIELVGARPGQGVSSMFRFGRAFGTVIGVLGGLHIPYTLVTPAKWKKHFHLDGDKEKSRALALRTFVDTPQHFARKKDDGRAEAALLAMYGAHMLARREAA